MSVLRVAQTAVVFMGDIESALRAKPVSVPLKLIDGTGVSSLVIPEGKELTAKFANGQIKQIGWEEFPPDQLLALHRELGKNASDDKERLRRQITAIAFDWLAGDRKRAADTAENLSGNNEDFGKIWDAFSPGLPD